MSLTEPRTLNIEPALTVQGYPVYRNGYQPRSVQALQLVNQWQFQTHDTPDLWLRMEIGIAFKQLICLRLGNTPAVEMLPFVAEQWVETIGEGMTEAADRERIKHGFKQLCRTLKWWPQPAELLNVLPRRQAPKPSAQARAAEPADINTTADGEALQDILNLLDQKDKEGTTHGP